MTTQINKRFKLPVRTALIVFEGTDFEGAEVKVKLDVPMSVFLQMEAMINGERPTDIFEAFGREVLLDWNISDDEGKEIPATGVGMLKAPLRFANIVMQQWVEQMGKPSDPLSVPSTDGNTSKAEQIKTDAR